ADGRRGGLPKGWCRVDLPAEYEVLGGERRAVVPGQVRLEVIGRLHTAVGQEAPAVAVQLRKSLSEVRMVDFPLVEHIECRVEYGRGSLDRRSEEHERLAC